MVEAPSTIPDSGGILDTTEHTLLIVLASLVVIIGLLAAGIWNIQRRKRRADSDY